MVQTTADTLDAIDLLKPLSQEERQRFARACRWRSFAAGEQIIDRQSESRDVYFVVRGKARVVNYALSGREVTLDDLLPGAFFGELAALDSLPRSAGVMAYEPTTVAIASPEQFTALVTGTPEIALSLMRRLCNVIRSTTERVMDLSTLAANNRVQAELLRQARAAAGDGDRAVLRPPPIHSEIASRVSTTRETVARVLSDLARQGIVRRHGNALEIPDVERLAHMVEEVRGE